MTYLTVKSGFLKKIIMDHFELSVPPISRKVGIFHNGPVFITFKSGQHVTTADNVDTFLKPHNHIHRHALVSVGCQTPTSAQGLLWGGGEEDGTETAQVRLQYYTRFFCLKRNDLTVTWQKVSVQSG